MLYLKGDFLNAGIAWFALGLAVAHIYAIRGRSTSFGSPYLVIFQCLISLPDPANQYIIEMFVFTMWEIFKIPSPVLQYQSLAVTM